VLFRSENAAVVVKGLCWVLGDIAIKASRTGDTSIDQALRVTIDQLIQCTALLATEGLQEPETIQ